MLSYLVAGLLLLAPVQIMPTSPARQRADARRALREARHTDAPYQESHLAAERRPPRRGAGKRPVRVPGEPRFGPDGTPHVARPLLPGLRRRPKTEP